MATLTEKKRDNMADSKFGLPEEHKYPMPDKAHARNAKARASQQVKVCPPAPRARFTFAIGSH